MNTVASNELDQMERIVEGLPSNSSKSEKIRQLAAAGFQKADIARFLGIRYQFVYNVLSAPGVKASAASAGTQAGSDQTDAGLRSGDETAAEPSDRWVWIKIEKGGRIALPAAFWESLGVTEGDDVQLRLDGDSVQIMNRAAALRSLQEDVRRYIPEGHSLVDELIAERRAEAAAESDDG